MPVWNVRDAFTEARDRYFLPRSVDSQLSGVEQALCGEAAGACDRAINALDGSDQWPQGQRQARYTDCRDKAVALATVDNSHGFSDPLILYAGLELLDDAATTGRNGLTTFFSSVEPLP